MGRLARSINKSGFFHVMSQGLDKSYIFKEEQEKEKYLSLLKRYYKKYHVKLISYCIMNNHVHLLFYTNDILEVSKYMKAVNTVYGKYYNKKYERIGFVYRNRFKSQYINNERYLLYCIKYIHMNPVKAGMVIDESEYKYSSYNDYINKNGFVDDEVIKMVFNNYDYLHTFRQIEDKEIEVLDIDKEKDNFRVAVKDYLNENNISLEEIKSDNFKLILFCEYLKNKKYKQIQIAELLEIPVRILSAKLSNLKR